MQTVLCYRTSTSTVVYGVRGLRDLLLGFYVNYSVVPSTDLLSSCPRTTIELKTAALIVFNLTNVLRTLLAREW